MSPQNVSDVGVSFRQSDQGLEELSHGGPAAALGDWRPEPAQSGFFYPANGLAWWDQLPLAPLRALGNPIQERGQFG